MHCFNLVEMFPLNSIFFNIESMALLKTVADNGSPCLIPVWTSNFSVNSLFIFTIAFVPVSVSAINFFNFTSVDLLKSLCIVNKCIMEIYIIFIAFFKSLAYNEYTVKC